MQVEDATTEKNTRQKKSRERRAEIIDSALKVLAFEGAAKFTLRNVAEKAGVTLGAVQYYFKSKSDLLLALTDYKLQQDYSATVEARRKSGLSPEDEFIALINLLFRDNKKPLVYGLDFQLFALACSDKTAEQCVNTFYLTVRNWMEDLILSMTPTLSKEECAYRAIVVLSMLEGMMQVLYRDSRNRSDFSAVEERVRQEALGIARAPA